jgi:cytochrome c oxidase subunit 2
VVVHEPDAYDAWLKKNSPVTATVASAPSNPTA